MLEAAQRIVVEQGVGALTLASVGKEAGYSRGIVNHAFGTRHALVRRLVEDLQDRLAVEVSATELRGMQRIQRWAAAYMAAFEHREDDARAFLTLWAHAVASDVELRPIFVERDAYFREAIAREIETGQADGTVRADVDADAGALAIVGQLRGVGMQLLLAPDASTLKAVSDTLTDCLLRALRA